MEVKKEKEKQKGFNYFKVKYPDNFDLIDISGLWDSSLSYEENISLIEDYFKPYCNPDLINSFNKYNGIVEELKTNDFNIKFPIVEFSFKSTDRFKNGELKPNKFIDNYNQIDNKIKLSIGQLIPNADLKKVIHLLKSRNDILKVYFDNFLKQWVIITHSKTMLKIALNSFNDWIVKENNTTINQIGYFNAHKSFLSTGKNAVIIADRLTKKSYTKFKYSGGNKILYDLKN